MTDLLSKPSTAFAGHRLIGSGPLITVALAAKDAIERDPTSTVLTFDNATGAVIDLDLRGTTGEVVSRLSRRYAASKPTRERAARDTADGPAKRGRPRLGVIAREVTLLPRHWEWLSSQPGGASQALRRLVDDARRSDIGNSRVRLAREAAYRFMSAMAGDFPGFEEAARALFAGDHERLVRQTAKWPRDVRTYVLQLAPGGEAPAGEAQEPRT